MSGFYSSPSCDGDHRKTSCAGYTWSFYSSPSCDGDHCCDLNFHRTQRFYSSPSCDGDRIEALMPTRKDVSILPRLATGIVMFSLFIDVISFYSSPSCDGDLVNVTPLTVVKFLFFPVLRRGSFLLMMCSFPPLFLFFPVLRRGSPRRGD